MVRYKSLFFLLFLCFLPYHAAAQTLQTPIDGVMATGKQIAQVRFMLEVYSTIGAGIQYQAPKAKLTNAIQDYEETLDMLQKAFPDPSIQTAIQKSHQAWPPVKKALLTALETQGSAAMKQQALFVHGNIRTVIKEMETIKDHLLKKTNTSNAKEINAGIEIAASARRLSSHYMLKMWQVPDPTIDEHWNKGIQKYQSALDELRSSPFAKDPDISQWLKTCEKEFMFFKTVFSFDDFMPVLVERNANKAYEAAGKIVMQLSKN